LPAVRTASPKEERMTQPETGKHIESSREELLNIDKLKMYFHVRKETVKAVDEVSVTIKKGETLGVVGESGSGKSMTAMSILRLIPMPPGKFEGGAIYFNGQNLMTLSEKKLRDIRGSDISMIFQEPMTSLNPVFRVGDQIIEG